MRDSPSAKRGEQCLALLEEVDSDGIVITKRGRPLVKLQRGRVAALRRELPEGPQVPDLAFEEGPASLERATPRFARCG
jgi:hypothetical protein